MYRFSVTTFIQTRNMKRIFILALTLLVFSSVHSQSAIYGSLGERYRDFMIQAASQFNNKATQNDFLGLGGAKRFESDYWLFGGATNNFEVTIENDFMFNYDYLAHELHAKWKDTSIIVNTSYVKRFYFLQANVKHYFVKSPVLDPQGKYFYESLAFDEKAKDSGKIQLLKLRKIKIIKTNKNDYAANFSGDYSDKYDNNIEYFLVFPDKTYTKVKLSQRSMTSALAKYKTKVDEFLKEFPGDFTELTAAGLINDLNQ